MIPFLDLTRQHAALKRELMAAAGRVLDGSHFVLGAEGRALETELMRLTDTRHAVGVGSGTDALRLALAALGVARVLSSGGGKTASDGVDELRAMVQRAADRLVVVAGGGVRANNARAIVERTGVAELHARCGGDAARIRGIVDAVNRTTAASG